MVYNIRLFNPNDTDFTTNGLGCLHEASACEVTEERNGMFELTLSYPASGHLYSQINVGSIIVCKSNPFSSNQAFRIYSISKPIRGIVKFNAAHISYDLSNYAVRTPIREGDSAVTIKKVLDDVFANIIMPDGSRSFSYTLMSPLSDFNTATFNYILPATAKSILGGSEGSILDQYHVEYEFDNYTVKVYNNDRGANNAVSIRYGKNLTGLTYSEDISEAYTYYYPYFYNETVGVLTVEGATVDGHHYDSPIIPLVDDPEYVKVLMLDVSSDFQIAPYGQRVPGEILRCAAIKLKEKDYTSRNISVDISFVQLGNSKEYEKLKDIESIKLCDTINCYNEDVGVDFTAKCVKTVYDALTDKYTSISLGYSKLNLIETFVKQDENARSNKNTALNAMTAGNTAQTAAEAAQSTANTASNKADAAQTTATNAQSTANTASSKADAAQSTANTANNKADAAQTTANTAQSTANTASSKADAAQSTANGAQTTATNAQNTATAAQSTANTASSKADAAQSAADEAQDGVIALNTLFSDASGRSHVTLKKNAAGSAIEEIIVSDNPDYMATTTHLWRWNSQGLAYTNGGYNSSEYILGMNMNGKIWANYIDVQDSDGNSIFVADGQNKFVHMGLFNINELGLTYNYTERTEPNIHKSINIDPYAITFEKIDDNNDTIDRIYISPESIYFNQERTIGSHSLELTNKHVNLTYNDDSGIYLEMPSASGPIFRIGSSDDGPAPNAFSISYERVTENKAYLTLNGQTISDIATSIENSNSSVPTSALLYSVKNQIPTVVDNHTSTSTTAALSANQGKVLYELIQQSGGGVDIIDNLTSTRTDAALSANQGRVLKGLIPSNVSDLVNDRHYITESELSGYVPNTRKVNGKALSSDVTLYGSDISVEVGSLSISEALEQVYSDKQDKITSSNKLSSSLVSGLATVATSGSYNDLSDKPTIPSGITGAGVYYGVCSTAAATAAKTVTLSRGDGFALTTGVTVLINFTNANSAANPTLNVNGSGAKAMMQYGTTAMSTSSGTTGWYAGAMVELTYNGTNWVRTQWVNSTYYYTSIYSTSSGSTAAKVGNVSGGFSLTAGKNFQVMMYSNNTSASALTLNIASTGAKPIYINGQPSSATNYTLPAGEYLVYYDGTNYYFDTDGTFRAKNIIADNLETLTDGTPYLFRKSGGDLDVGNRESIKKLSGGTIVWNQLVSNGNFADATGWSVASSSYGTLSVSNNKAVWTCTTVPASYTNTGVRRTAVNDYKVPIGNIAYARAYCTSSIAHRVGLYFMESNAHYNYVQKNINANERTLVEGIIQLTHVGDRPKFCYVSDVADLTIGTTLTCEEFEIYDITKMFGASVANYIYSVEQSNAGSGIAIIKPFIENANKSYNAGELVSVKTSAHETIGFNAWDEVCESGSLDDNTGEPVSASNLIRSKNYCRCIPNTNYYFYCGTAGGIARVFFYDKYKNLIEKRNDRNNVVVISPSNAAYFKIRLAATYGTVYKNDVCISISNLSRNGIYESYVKHTYPIDDVELRGMVKLDASNKLYYDGDKYTEDGIVTRKYGIVDMGTLSWTYRSAQQAFSLSVRGFSKTNGYVVSTLYPQYFDAFVNMPDKSIATFSIFNGQDIVVKDSRYTSAAAFKTAMSGVYLVYELATPTTESASPLTNPQIIDPNGTEEFVDTRSVPMPVSHETVYLTNVVGNAIGELLQPIKPSSSISFRVITLSGDYDVLTGQDFADYYTNPSPAHMIYHSGQRQYYYLQLKDSDTDPKIYYVCPSSSTSYAIRDTIEVTPTGYWSLWA